ASASSGVARRIMWEPQDLTKKDKPRQALKNNTTGVREREHSSRASVARNRDEVEGVGENTHWPSMQERNKDKNNSECPRGGHKDGSNSHKARMYPPAHTEARK